MSEAAAVTVFVLAAAAVVGLTCLGLWWYGAPACVRCTSVDVEMVDDGSDSDWWVCRTCHHRWRVNA